MGFGTLPKVSKKWGFCGMSKNDGRRGAFEEICKDAFSVAGAVQETCSSEMLGGPGAYFLRGIAFWSIRSSGLLRWFCVTGATLRMAWHHFFWQGQHFKHMDWKKYKTHWHEAVSSALNFPWLTEVSQNCFVFDAANFRKSRRIASFLMLPTSNFRKSRRIASFLMLPTSKFRTSRRIASFLMLPTSKFRKSRRITSFLSLSSSKVEEVSQNSVFKLADK